MPEIVLPGLRHVGGGTTEADHKLLREARQNQQVKMWTHEGTDEECENSWREFLLAGTPDWVIYS